MSCFLHNNGDRYRRLQLLPPPGFSLPSAVRLPYLLPHDSSVLGHLSLARADWLSLDRGHLGCAEHRRIAAESGGVASDRRTGDVCRGVGTSSTCAQLRGLPLARVAAGQSLDPRSLVRRSYPLLLRSVNNRTFTSKNTVETL